MAGVNSPLYNCWHAERAQEEGQNSHKRWSLPLSCLHYPCIVQCSVIHFGMRNDTFPVLKPKLTSIGDGQSCCFASRQKSSSKTETRCVCVRACNTWQSKQRGREKERGKGTISAILQKLESGLSTSLSVCPSIWKTARRGNRHLPLLKFALMLSLSQAHAQPVVSLPIHFLLHNTQNKWSYSPSPPRPSPN